jgi:hypothetical protein
MSSGEAYVGRSYTAMLRCWSTFIMTGQLYFIDSWSWLLVIKIESRYFSTSFETLQDLDSFISTV